MLTFVLGLTGCNLTGILDSGPGYCGDGACEPIEMRMGCTQDCGAEAEDGAGDYEQRLMLGMMVHIEGWTGEEKDEDKFNKHVDAVLAMADIFEANGAVATFEARPEFIRAQDNWGRNVLQELKDRGHGVGIHADVGGQAPEDGTDLALMTKQLKDMRVEGDKLTGIKMKHASGVCSKLDWAKALIDAGYEFTTGNVSYCAMSMPEEIRPEEYKNCESPMACHETYPSNINQVLHPWRVSDAQDWLYDDRDGELVIMASDGVLYGMAEEKEAGKVEKTKKDFTTEDLDVYIERLEEALAAVDPGQVNTLYVAWSIGDADRAGDPLLDEWLKRVQPYVDENKVVWKSINDMYDEYRVWESGQ